MSKVGSFTSKSWGEVDVWTSKYANGALAVQLTARGEPLATLSVNMYRPDCSHNSAELPRDCFFVKTWSENAEIAAEAIESGLFVRRPDLPVAISGYVQAEAWQLK